MQLPSAANWHDNTRFSRSTLKELDRFMTSRARFLVSCAGSAVAASFPTAIFAQTRKTLTIGYVPSTLFAPVFVADNILTYKNPINEVRLVARF